MTEPEGSFVISSDSMYRYAELIEHSEMLEYASSVGLFKFIPKHTRSIGGSREVALPLDHILHVPPTNLRVPLIGRLHGLEDIQNIQPKRLAFLEHYTSP